MKMMTTLAYIHSLYRDILPRPTCGKLYYLKIQDAGIFDIHSKLWRGDVYFIEGHAVRSPCALVLYW